MRSDIKSNIFIIEIVTGTPDFIRNQKRSHSNDFKNIVMEFILIFEYS